MDRERSSHRCPASQPLVHVHAPHTHAQLLLFGIYGDLSRPLPKMIYASPPESVFRPASCAWAGLGFAALIGLYLKHFPSLLARGYGHQFAGVPSRCER